MANHLSTTDQSWIEEQPQRGSAKAKHARQDRVIRDGFSMPASDYALVLEIRAQLLNAGVHATKSGVLRAALHALNQLSIDDIVQILTGLETIQTGRPPSKK